MFTKRFQTFFIILAISSIVSSCGFRLKGQYYLPESLQVLYVTADKRFSPLAKQVKLRLKQNDVSVIEKDIEGVSELKILPEQFQRRTLSLFPNGQVAEYELLYQIKFQLYEPNKDVQEFSVELSREFQDDPTNALAKQKERELILSELRVMASDRILMQLNTVQ